MDVGQWQGKAEPAESRRQHLHRLLRRRSFRAYHSDVAETPFATVQDLNSSDRKYAYVIWKLSDDGKHLSLRNVSDKVISKETKDSGLVLALLTKNAGNPDLFGEEIEFRKEK